MATGFHQILVLAITKQNLMSRTSCHADISPSTRIVEIIEGNRHCSLD
jgi:hypothetical protein